MNPTAQKQQEIKELVSKLEPNSDRRQLIDAARAFKSNWVTFGEYLTRVASDKLYEAWGYKSFEEYCSVEIRIKKNTAIKLTNAYFFATQTEPAIGASFEAKGVPELEVVNFLHKAKQDDNCTEEMFEDLKDAAIEKGQSGPTLARRLKLMTAPVGPAAKKQAFEQSLRLVKRLQQQFDADKHLPDQFNQYLNEMQEYLDQKVATAEDPESQPHAESA